MLYHLVTTTQPSLARWCKVAYSRAYNLRLMTYRLLFTLVYVIAKHDTFLQ